jgi:amino acid transporter
VEVKERPPEIERPERTRVLERIKRVIIGRPMATERLIHERLGKPTALAVFASDNLSSSAYATEEILRVLIFTPIAAAVAFRLAVPITLALLAVLGILLFSYRQTIRAYPQAGGAYLVTRDNFGMAPAQVAGVALLTDYILTVSVSVAAGTAALVSAFPALFGLRVFIAVGFIFVIAIGNLRGVREAGRIFAAPTYFFVTMMGVLLLVSAYRLITGNLPEVSTFPAPTEDLKAASLFVILHAFASGGAAVTGVEAISNGVPAFRPPEWRNAITTLMWMGGLLGTMFFGISVMASRLHIVPDPEEKVTVLAQLGRGVFGHAAVGDVLFLMLQVGTMLILVLAANTSFADFPRLASFQAGDRFLPTQLTRYGDRLVFSNGIIVLSLLATVLVIVFKASVTRLIPLYAIGVFTSFTFSQAGMARRHTRIKERGWKHGLVINGVGAVVSALMTVIIASTKFTDGAWVILVSTPVILWALFRVHAHYEDTIEILSDPSREPPADVPRQRVIIAMGEPGRDDRYAVSYGYRCLPTELHIVHFAYGDEDGWAILREAHRYGFPMEVRDGTKSLLYDLRSYIRKLRPTLRRHEMLNVIIPETVEELGWRHIFRRYRIQRLKGGLLNEPDVVVTNITHHAGYEELEPGDEKQDWREAAKEWRHAVVLLVGGVHNGTLAGLRYARSLGADELHCLYVSIDDQKTQKTIKEWDYKVRSIQLEVLSSEYRQLTRPVFDFVRDILNAHPKTFVTIVIPEFLVKKRWHNILHNKTALLLKGAFLFEPSVVVAAVPYKLEREPVKATSV